jgi:hypothetical protein
VGWLLHVHHQQICPRLMLDELECRTYLIDVQQSAELQWHAVVMIRIQAYLHASWR